MRRASFEDYPLPTNKEGCEVNSIEVEVGYMKHPITFVRLKLTRDNSGREIYTECKEHDSTREAFEYAQHVLEQYKDWTFFPEGGAL